MSEAAREPVQIVKITFPKCGNVFGVAPCTATGAGDEKCFNTFATCRDIDNYRSHPEDAGWGETDLIKLDGETITSSELGTSANVVAAFDIRFPLEPSGTIWGQGGTGDGLYLGFTGGNLVLRGGDGSDPQLDGFRVVVPDSSVVGRSGQLFAMVNTLDGSEDLQGFIYFFDPVTKAFELLGSGGWIANAGTLWAGSADGAIGTDANGIVNGEDGGDFNGVISEARFYQTGVASGIDQPGEDDFRKVMYFTRKQNYGDMTILEDLIPGETIYPMLQSVTTTGARINLAQSNKDYDPLGNRATCNITVADGLGSDIGVDPYLSDRTYTPLDLSTFWLKLLARQKYGKLNALVEILEGFAGQSLSEFTTRTYIIERADLPRNGMVQIHCRDILTRTDLEKAQAPRVSTGLLSEPLLVDETTSFITRGHEIDDYPASGTVRINDELIQYSAISDNGDGTFTWTISGARGSDGSEPDDHEIDDAVQECLRYTDQRIDDVLLDLLAEYAGIDYQLIDLQGFEDEVTNYLSAYRLTTLISVPTGVKELVGQISLQCSFYTWWDEREQLVTLKAIRGLETVPGVLGDDVNLIADSIRVREKPKERVSQVWSYYNPGNFTELGEEPKNWLNLYAEADLQSEGRRQYGQKQVRVIYSTWLTTEAEVAQSSARILGRYSEVPVEIEFELDSKDRAIWTGDVYLVTHNQLVDAFGNQQEDRLFLITSSEDDLFAGKAVYTAEDATLAGYISVILANSVGDYQGDGTDQANGAWISDSNGFYSNGDRGARIS